jgi:hypothetical protein
MRWLNQLVMQVRMLLFRRLAATQLNEELRFHMEQQIAENRSTGMSEEEAASPLCGSLAILIWCVKRQAPHGTGTDWISSCATFSSGLAR